MKRTILLFAGLAFLTFKNQAQTVTDYDGNVYNTVTIGTQVWMKENLKTTHYSTGVAMVDGTSAGDISGDYTTKYYFDYGNTPANTIIYGKLYTWAAVMNGAASSNSEPSGVQGACPIGWHLPSDAEWTTLTTFLGGESVAGGKLKETGTTHWQSPNTGATNETGFTALPGGNRYDGGTFYSIGSGGDWWSSTEDNTNDAWYRYMGYDDSGVGRNYGSKTNGFSVRCLRDNGSSIEDINYQEKIKIYPNPTIDRVYVDCAEQQVIKMQIYNVVGECVLKRELGSGTNDIDISSLPTGIYVIKITGADWTVQRKLTKE